MKDRDRVIVSLAVFFQNPNGSSGFARGAEKDVLKKRLIDVIRTGASEEQTPRLHVFHGVAIQIFIGAERFCDIVPFFHKGGRIEDDDIVIPVRFLQKIEDIFTNESVAFQIV